MLNGSLLDNLIRSNLNEEVRDETPAASVRDSLLIEAARVQVRSGIGLALPPLVSSLCEVDQRAQERAGQRPTFLEHAVAEKWLTMIIPLYAVR
jgi:hypothetical protein